MKFVSEAQIVEDDLSMTAGSRVQRSATNVELTALTKALNGLDSAPTAQADAVEFSESEVELIAAVQKIVYGGRRLSQAERKRIAGYADNPAQADASERMAEALEVFLTQVDSGTEWPNAAEHAEVFRVALQAYKETKK